MTNTLDVLKPRHLDYVSHHVNQTHLVNDLLGKGILLYEDVEGLHPNEYGEYPEIFQWLVFPHFYETDYERLSKAGIPVLDSDYGSWVGLTSCGSPYDLYVYPELIGALFSVKCSYEDVERCRRG